MENPPETRVGKSQKIKQLRKPACILNKLDEVAGVARRSGSGGRRGQKEKKCWRQVSRQLGQQTTKVSPGGFSSPSES